MSRCAGLTPKEHDSVEALFAQDFPGVKMPASLRPVVARSLVAKGWAEPMEAVVGRDRLGLIIVKAWRLTIADHMRYCAWAGSQEDDA